MRIALYQPQIAQNVGNIIRLAANTNSELHLIRPYGFIWESRKRKRAALDYGDDVMIVQHDSFAFFWQQLHTAQQVRPTLACHLLTTHAHTSYHDIVYGEDDFLLFGAETHGVDETVRRTVTSQARIPMAHASRSINLANSAAIVLYEALKQHNFAQLN